MHREDVSSPEHIVMYLNSLKLGRLRAYKQLLALGKERKESILLDIGCCCEYILRPEKYPADTCTRSW